MLLGTSPVCLLAALFGTLLHGSCEGGGSFTLDVAYAFFYHNREEIFAACL